MEMVNAGLINITIIDDITVKLWAQILPKLDVHYNVVLQVQAI